MLETFLEDHNELIPLIKRVSPRLQNDNYQVVIKAEKVPLGEHAGRFNAPTVDEVAIIMVDDPVDKRAIKITRRDNTVSTISDLHRSYEALQYPLIFCKDRMNITLTSNSVIQIQVLKEIKTLAQ
ncbi:unnamed protein product [Parnassius apollo]|uniref:(apollo) hypothetical protein n=1 Tax=Parnassius apollo TaxID=110799 RepID=A0A8S3X724_PARAO|nr:unnamed protein product [Parnassius apollo]